MNISEIRRPVTMALNTEQQRLVERESRRGDSWGDYNRTFDAYMEDFSSVINKNVLLRQLSVVKYPVIVDLMASTDAILTLFMELPQLDKFGIAVGRKDNRDEFEARRDKHYNINYLSGDLMKSKTWHAISDSLAGQKANLIMEDGKGAWEFFPKNKLFLGLMLNRCWRLLSDNNGTLLLEIPSAEELKQSEIDIEECRDILLKNSIDFDYAFPVKDRGFLRLKKTELSPKILPHSL